MPTPHDGRDASASLERKVESDLARLFREPDPGARPAAGAARPATRGPRDAAQEIERCRARLLDLRNGNRLLSFEHSERSRAHVRAIDAQPDALYAQLNEGHQLLFVSLPEPEGKAAEEDGDEFLMALEEARATDPDYLRVLGELDDADPDSRRLQAAEGALRERVREQLGLPPSVLSGVLPLAEHAKKHGIDPSFELAKPAGNVPAKAAGTVQTLLLAGDMDRKLTGLHDRARTSLQEKGVNTLYAVFGFLEWYESPATPQPFHAPLLLVPVEVKRKVFKSRYRYAIRASGEEPQINLTLAARIAADFGIELPEFGEEDTPESYFAKVTQALSAKHRWRVRRWVTIGHFAFARLVVYRDLDPRNWPGAAALERHPVLAAMFGEARASEQVYAEEYDPDQPEVAKKVPLLITDADSSQFSALVDALDGKSLALQGPPGTGKSQTITNLIAAALAAGKTVLFVAEKLAALEVVKNRLAAAGLGEFVLELHSTRAGKKEVMASIGERLKIQGRVRAPANLERDLEELARARTALARHAELLNAPAGKLGLTLHQCLWAELRLRQQRALPAGVAEVRVREANAVTPEQAQEIGAQLAFVEQANAEIRARFGRVADHPWFGLCKGGLAGTEEAALLRALQGWRQALDGVRAVVDAFQRTSGTRAPEAPGELASLATMLTRLPGGGAVDARYFAALSDRTTRSELKAYREAVEAFREARDQLARAGDPARLLEEPARIAELGRKARELKLADRSVAELAALLSEYRSDVAAWGGVLDTARQLQKLYGIEGPIGSRTVAAAMEGARIVASTPPEALVLRERTLMDPVNGGALEDAARRQLEIQAQLKHLSPDFSLPLDDADAPARLRRHAAVLNGSGFFSFLSSKVRAARVAWSELRRRPGQADDAEKSAQLYALAAAVEAAQKFNADERLLELCTTHFRGHETDFHRLLAVNRFAREVRERLGTDSVLRAVRGVLLEGNLDTLNDIIAFASPEVRQGLTWALAKCGPDNTHWEAFALEVGEWERSMTTLLEAAAALGLSGEVRLSELDALAAVAERAARCRGAMESAVAARILGPTFAPLMETAETDAPALDSAVDVVVGLVSLGLSEELLAFLLSESFAERRAALVEHGNALFAAMVHAGEQGATALAAGAIDELAFLGQPLASAPFDALRTRLARALENTAALGPWSAYCQALAVVEATGLTPLLAAYDAQGRPYQDLGVAFRQALLRSIVRAAQEQHAELAQVLGPGQDAARARFQELDREVMRQQCKELRAELCRRRLDPGEKNGSKSSWTGLALINNEVKKRGRHFPLRELVRRAGRTLQQAKPCFMMSPPSVAQYLAHGSVGFDLVVIDEASQMRPEDAIGALARGRQAIVVGDPMQLPPTGFFDRERPPTDEELAAEERASDESILEAALSAFRPARRLRWHYRSRHAALIAFSNAHFYQGDLVVFPAPSQSDPALGVQCVPVENGLYRGSMNRPEAERVAGEVLRFMQDHPEKSLGIVAMNQPQRDLILHEVERMVARDARAQRYTEQWESERGGLEAFFVKSLETVQGDERDVIFVSATYGPDASGRVHQRFGPINGQHGHRRLNVLFTRAKERVVLFTSMRPDQVEVDEHASRGRRALQAYLEYAQHGSLEPAGETARALESELEAFVVEALRARGYEAELRVGASGQWIDLAVRHPQQRGALVLGLEGDGPSYLGVRSTRDRDRLRAQVLAALGWQLHRIWSLAWYADPENESERLLAAVEQATRRHDRATKKAG